MKLMSQYRVCHVYSIREWQDCLEVLNDTYVHEKQWSNEAKEIFPINDLGNRNISWFVAYIGREPAGVLRVSYELPSDIYKKYDIKLLEDIPNIEYILQNNKFAEIGRFAVKEKFRSRITVASHLMRAAVKDTIQKEYDYYITDIFEGEKHNPYLFHTRLIGFKPVAVHDFGEINCKNRRITMVLNLKECYNVLKNTKKQVFNFFTESWSENLHLKMS